MNYKDWENGIRKPPDKNGRKQIILLICVSLSSFKNSVLPLLQRAVKINYLTYTKYYKRAPCNLPINQNVRSFDLGQCIVFRGD